jgi:hypothetical protein
MVKVQPEGWLILPGAKLNGTNLSSICMNAGHEPGTVGNDTP